MNTTRILIYGERLEDLREARIVLAEELPHPTTDELIVVAPFIRAMGRAHAEVLLELADLGGTAIIAPAVDVREVAAGRVLLEMWQVEAEPLVLHSHPTLAAAGRRSSEADV